MRMMDMTITIIDTTITTEFFQPSWDDCFHLDAWFPLEVGHPNFFRAPSLPLIQQITQLAYLMYNECLYPAFSSFPQIQQPLKCVLALIKWLVSFSLFSTCRRPLVHPLKANLH